MAASLPRLSPGILHRLRIESWLERNAARPLRFLCGPAGLGKTAALTLYLSSRPRAFYVTLKDDEAPEQLREQLARSAGVKPSFESLRALVAALAAEAPCEIAIDGLDAATPETLEELAELAAAAPDGASLLFAARSRTVIDLHRFLANGLAAMLDASQLAFDADELACLAEYHRVPFRPGDVARLLEETDGWPIVAAWVIRDAAETGTPLEGAYDRWRRSTGRLFNEFMADELRGIDDASRNLLHSVLSGASDDGDALAALEAQGLFVHFNGDGYRVYRVARQFAARIRPAAAAAEPGRLLVIRMFGRFEAEIAGRRIEWIRRREAQLFKYLLLKPKGSATRAELRNVFWPQSDYHLATQSLRTASSNIRKALAAIVGYANVDRYFSSRGDITVNLERAVVDVRRFAAHVADGDAEFERGNGNEAFAHYRAAESLYGGDLLSGEYPETWYEPRAEMYKVMYGRILDRLAKSHEEAGRFRHAREYAARAGKLRTSNDFAIRAGA
ncbi:MAG: AAA family ATPase [Candidatus Baltobacteraceae bacterium]